MQRPTPRAQLDDPRGFQLAQLRRRYAPAERSADGATVLEFSLTPSDPDFPYDIDKLECVLTVPQGFPAAPAALRIRNRDMPRGYQINVERGFDTIAMERPHSTLLQWLNFLDRRLENLLAAPKAETIKLFANSNKLTNVSSAEDDHPQAGTSSIGDVEQRLEPSFTTEQIADAAQIREAETRQLEARLGRMPLFSKDAKENTYTVPVEPRRRNDLPQALQSVKVIKLFVPELYNLEQCRIQMVGIDAEEARKVENAFASHVSDSSHLTLLNHVNYLAQHMHTMAKQAIPRTVVIPISLRKDEAVEAPTLPGALHTQQQLDDDRKHIVKIPRPPEWSLGIASDDDDSYDSYSYDSGDETEDEEEKLTREGEASVQSAPPVAERGILLSFPHLELYGIELLELVSLSITIKCDRCKDATDASKIKNNDRGDYTGMHSIPCKKCANSMSIGDDVPGMLVQYLELTLRRVSNGFASRQQRASWISRLGWLYCGGSAAEVPALYIFRPRSCAATDDLPAPVTSYPHARNAPLHTHRLASSRFEASLLWQCVANAIAK